MNGEDCALTPRRGGPRVSSVLAGLLLALWAGLAPAQWSGVEVSLANTDSDWDFDGEARQSSVSQLSLLIEERTNPGLRIGAGFGHLSVRLVAEDPAETRKFDAQFLALYLRQPVQLTPTIEWHTQFNLRYFNGRDSDQDDPADVDWIETDLQFGLGFRVAQFRIMPFVTYTDVDGDLDEDAGTRLFELDQPDSHGIALDYFTDSSAYVRLEIYGGSRSGGYLTFSRRY